MNVRETEVSSELRAAAAARALSFYTYPADRSEFSVRAHRNMRIDAEWDAIRAKIAGTDVAFRRSRVTCLVATLDLDQDGVAPGGWAEAGVDANLDPSCFANVAPDGSNARTGHPRYIGRQPGRQSPRGGARGYLTESRGSDAHTRKHESGRRRDQRPEARRVRPRRHRHGRRRAVLLG